MKIKAKITTRFNDGSRTKALIEVNSIQGDLIVTGRLVISSKKAIPENKNDVIIEIPDSK